MREARAQDGLEQRREGRYDVVRLFRPPSPVIDGPDADDAVKFFGARQIISVGVTRALDTIPRFFLLFWLDW
jgi:hypothetical protein